jgi:hypothetical protein
MNPDAMPGVWPGLNPVVASGGPLQVPFLSAPGVTTSPAMVPVQSTGLPTPTNYFRAFATHHRRDRVTGDCVVYLEAPVKLKASVVMFR